MDRSERVAEVYHRSRGARIVGHDSADPSLTAIMSACRKNPKADHLWIVFLVFGALDSVESEYYTEDEFEPDEVEGTFAVRVVPEPFITYSEVWEQVGPQLEELAGLREES